MLGNLKMKVNEIFKGLSGEILNRINPGRQHDDDDEQEQRRRDHQARQHAIINKYSSAEPQQAQTTDSSTTTDTQTQTGQVLSNMRIAEYDPLVISYGKKLFHLNSKGQWAYLGSDAPIKDQTSAALLTKFAELKGL